VRIHPGNWTSNGAESQAQIGARNHLFSGPVSRSGKATYGTYKITSAATFMQNARLIIAQLPLEYTANQIAGLSAYDLKQFPNEEHKLHGTETIFETMWINRFPVINHHQSGETNTNGWLVCRVLENSLSSATTNPRLTLWVCANNIAYSMPITPSAIPAVNA
jgi:hypothetical protein